VETELTRIFDALPVIAWIALPDGHADFINRCWCDLAGRGTEEISGQGWMALVHPDDLPAMLASWHAMVASGKPGELRVRTRHGDGNHHWHLFRVGPLKNASGHVTRWYGMDTGTGGRQQPAEPSPASELDALLTIDAMPLPVAITAPSGEVRRVNRHALHYFGRSFEQLKRSKASEVVHPEDLPYIISAQSKAYETGSTYNVQSRHRRSDGVYRWFNVVGMPLRDAQGHISCWMHLLIDIDDQRRPEEALRTTERKLRSIIHTIPALVWSARIDGSVEFFNQHYLDYVGLSAEQVADWGWKAAVHPDDLDGLADSWQLIMASQAPGETEARLRRFDGEYRWFLFRVNPLRNEAGHIIKWYGISIDIDDRKRTEEQLRRSEAFLAEGQRISMTGSFSWCLDDNEVMLSDELYRIFGFDHDTTVTLDRIAGRIHPDDATLHADKKSDAREVGSDHDYEIRLRMPDGSVKHVHVVSHCAQGRDGQREYIGAIQDVTQRRASEETLGALRSELARMAKINSLGALTASIAHEVNQPLSGVITNASTCLRMLAADPPNIEGAIETARRAIRDGHRASDVITRVRALFSRKSSNTERVNLNDATKEVIALSQSTLKASRVTLKTDFCQDIPPVTGDRVQLQQVILNLLLNASEAMNGVDDRPREILVRTEVDEDARVRLTVQDSGVGFESEGLGKMFETFYTTKSSGMGIGLSISQSIIERHQGTLRAQANNGPGATFWFAIPRAGSDMRTTTSDSDATAPLLRAARVAGSL